MFGRENENSRKRTKKGNRKKEECLRVLLEREGRKGVSLLFVSSNKFKFQEMKKILEEEHGILLEQESFLFRELDASGLREITIDKARQAFKKFSVPLIAEEKEQESMV